ncbi:hypothetical protein, partial [Mesorhizobium sp. M7A.F.Ca.MR.362.00.0.0]
WQEQREEEKDHEDWKQRDDIEPDASEERSQPVGRMERQVFGRNQRQRQPDQELSQQEKQDEWLQPTKERTTD